MSKPLVKTHRDSFVLDEDSIIYNPKTMAKGTYKEQTKEKMMIKQVAKRLKSKEERHVKDIYSSTEQIIQILDM